MRLGTITMQALDNSDVFLKEDLFLDGVQDESEAETEIGEPGFEDNLAWVSGRVPGKIPVTVDGDASVIFGWFRGDNFPGPFTIKITIEYEDPDEEVNEG